MLTWILVFGIPRGLMTMGKMTIATAFLGKFLRSIRGIPKLSSMVLLCLIVCGIFAGSLSSHNPEIGELKERLLPPCWQEGGVTKYLLGTDLMGRDILSRLIYGTRISLIVSFSAVIVASFLGTILGVISGFLGGVVDQVIMRFTDAWYSIPLVMFGVLLAVTLGPGTLNIVIIISLVSWARYARVSRGLTLSLKSRDFIHLATIAGCGKVRIMVQHILPNVMNSMITLASLQIGVVVVMEASLTFLGVGVPPPKPAWGLMLAEGKSGLYTGHWWLITFPGLAIAMLVMSFNLLGDWLRRRLDPHFRYLWE